MYTHATFTIKGFVGKAESKTTNGAELATFSVATTKTWCLAPFFCTSNF